MRKDFVKEQRFENAGVFQYSQEENTAAAAMPDQVPEEIKQDRYDELMAIQAGISEEIHREMENRELEVVVEGYEEEESNLAAARSYREAPEIDGCIFVENAPGLKPGDFIRVRIEQGFAYEAVATRIYCKFPETVAKQGRESDESRGYYNWYGTSSGRNFKYELYLAGAAIESARL